MSIGTGRRAQEVFKHHSEATIAGDVFRDLPEPPWDVRTRQTVQYTARAA